MSDVIAYEAEEKEPFLAPLRFERPLPPAAQERLDTVTDTAVLENLHRKALLADSLGEFTTYLMEQTGQQT